MSQVSTSEHPIRAAALRIDMIDPPIVQELYRYNRWANERLLGAVASLGQEAFTSRRNLSSTRETFPVWMR